jgi:hypothetical protein
LALWSFLHEMRYVSVQVLALQSVLKFFFPLVIMTTSFGYVTKLFIVNYLFPLKGSGQLFA